MQPTAILPEMYNEASLARHALSALPDAPVRAAVARPRRGRALHTAAARAGGYVVSLMRRPPVSPQDRAGHVTCACSAR
ncbi:MAG TPA: hypothetical protein VFI47_08015 [Acidimicrobiales bacterium]|nr:hypothetical protein [Acidimicrobiales bacterium]